MRSFQILLFPSQLCHILWSMWLQRILVLYVQCIPSVNSIVKWNWMLPSVGLSETQSMGINESSPSSGWCHSSFENKANAKYLLSLWPHLIVRNTHLWPVLGFWTSNCESAGGRDSLIQDPIHISIAALFSISSPRASKYEATLYQGKGRVGHLGGNTKLWLLDSPRDHVLLVKANRPRKKV